MKGTNKFILNQETLVQALQEHMTTKVFDPGQIARVVDLKPLSTYVPYTYEVLVECDPQAEDNLKGGE